jgi:hypothetical protein
VRGCRAELASVYGDARNAVGNIDWQDAARAASVLHIIARMLEGAEIETVSPHALALSWQLAAAKSARGSHDNARGHGNDDHHNGGAHGSHFGHRDERGRGSAHDADHDHGRLHDNRGRHDGRSWGHGGNVQDQGGSVQDQGGSVPVDDEAPPS